MIEQISTSGLSPREILYTLRQKDHDHPATAKVIYNTKLKTRKENLPGRTMIQALVEEQEKRWFRVQLSKQ
jgi:uncharacterized NAD(P)/FAD-binding protein YdhS